jgi:hypothetical protein
VVFLVLVSCRQSQSGILTASLSGDRAIVVKKLKMHGPYRRTGYCREFISCLRKEIAVKWI